jgi:hypothetical protein
MELVKFSGVIVSRRKGHVDEELHRANSIVSSSAI